MEDKPRQKKIIFFSPLLTSFQAIFLLFICEVQSLYLELEIQLLAQMSHKYELYYVL